LSIAADALAGLPTLIKTVRTPETEHRGVFRNGMLNAAITLLVIRHRTFSAWAFPTYILIMASTFYALLRIRPLMHRSRRLHPAAGDS